MNPSAHDKFAQLLAEPDIDLAHAALLVMEVLASEPGAGDSAEKAGTEKAPEENAEAGARRTNVARNQLDELAVQARGCGAAENFPTLVSYVREDLGFSGNSKDYYDPNNSDLALVIERRTGIPITLAIVFIALGSRLGFDVRGIGFPGHFLVGEYSAGTADTAVGQKERYLLDPFAGVLVSRADCIDQLARGADQPVAPDDAWFQPSSPARILLRLLENLKQIQLGLHAEGAALRVLALQLVIDPMSFELRSQHDALLGHLFGSKGPTRVH